MKNFNTITIHLNPKTADKIIDLIPKTAKTKLMLSALSETGLEDKNKRCGVVLKYTEDKGAELIIGFDTDFVSICIEHAMMLVPMAKGAFGIFMKWAEKLNIWSQDTGKTEAPKIEDGDKMDIIYVIGDGDPVRETIIIGENSIHEHVDNELRGLPTDIKSCTIHVPILKTDVAMHMHVISVTKKDDGSLTQAANPGTDDGSMSYGGTVRFSCNKNADAE